MPIRPIMDGSPDASHEDLSTRLRRIAKTLPSPEEAKRRAVKDGLLLGLPERWLADLPIIGALPDGYVQSEFGEDAFLRWKAQEHLVRSGQLERCDPALLADALETAAAEDGPHWVNERLQDLLFALAWPGPKTYTLHVRIGLAAERLIDGLEDAPSALLFADVARSWRRVWLDIAMLAPDAELSDECPWDSLSALLAAAATAIDEGCAMERRRVRGECLPDKYRHFLD